MDNKNVTPGEIVVLVAGAVALIASFLAWIDISTGFGSATMSSWSTDGPLFPVATFVPLSAVVVAVLLALRKFANVTLPANIIGFSPDQIMKAFAIFGALLGIGWLIAIESAGIGFWLSLLAAIASAVGVFLLERDAATTARPGNPTI